MHKRLTKPSLMDEDDDEEISNFGKSSNRFLKSKNLRDQPKDDFQKELHERVNSNRSITPRSIDTDSDLGADGFEESDYLASLNNNHFPSNKSTLEGSGWQPGNKKSQKTSVLSDDSHSLNNSIFDHSNDRHFSREKPIHGIDKSKQSESSYSKSPREESHPVNFDVHPMDSPRKKADKDSKFSNENNLLKTLRYKDSEEMSNILDTINKKPEFNEKSKNSKTRFSLEDDEDDYNKPSPSSRFMKTKNNKTPEKEFQKLDLSKESHLIEDKSDFHRNSNMSKNKFGLDDDDDDNVNSLSSTRSKKKVRSHKNDDNEDDKSDKSLSSSRFLKSPRSKFPEEHSRNPNNDHEESNLKSHNFRSKYDNNDNDNDSFNEFLFSQKMKNSYDKFGRSDSPELDGTSNFLRENSDKKFNGYNTHDQELTNSTKLLKINQPNELESSKKSDVKPKPRKLYLSKTESEDGPLMSKSNLSNVPKDDIKRRSIRFEDEMVESFPKSSRESSPRKSESSRQNSSRNTPSPPTSICEEVVQDPFTLKLKALQKRREEKKREKESQFESNQSKAINDSINTVADYQQEKEPNHVVDSSRKSNSRPSSAKYRNIQPKITTRINLKSLKSPQANDEWSSTPNLNGDMGNINSERSYSSQSLRDAAYLQWYLAKLSEKNLHKQTEHPEEKKKATSEERLAAYMAWKNAKKDYFLELDRKRKEEEKKREESKIPVEKDKKSAELAFEVWKKQKVQKIKEESKKKSEENKQKELALMKEREMKKMKKSELITEWEAKKAKELQNKKDQMLKEGKAKEEKEKEIKQKLMEAERAYREWEEKAEIKEKKYSEFEKNKETLMNNRRAWRPSTNSIGKMRRM